MADQDPSVPIEGVRVLELGCYPDPRGRFLEAFRREWLPDIFTDQIQVNCSQSLKNVVRGLHYHTRQTDLWIPVSGTLRAGLVDTRPDSSTRGVSATLDMDGETPIGLLIPPGVAHGYSVMKELTLIYVVDRYYDPSDELGIAWNDPVIKLDWGIENPILSDRDLQNPPFNW